MKLFARWPLTIFFLLSFAISWLILSPGVASALGLLDFRFDGNLLFTLSALGPLWAAFLVTGCREGKAGVSKLSASVLRWKVKPRWWAATTLLLAGLFGLSALLANTRGKGLPHFETDAIFLMILFLFIASFGEEVGWRGFALPNLQKRHSPMKATLILTLFWWLWHLPVYWIMPFAREAVQKDGFATVFIAQFFICLALGLLCAWVYNGSRGSVLMPVVLHANWNLWQVPFSGQEAAVLTMPLFAVYALVVAFASKGKLGLSN